MSFDNLLKSISMAALEAAIAKTVGELTGVQYECCISHVSYDAVQGGTFDMSLTSPISMWPSDQERYFVYENWQAGGHRATVHFSTCRFCKDGKGIHPGASEAHGKWHGPFHTFQEASDAAEKTGGVVRSCQHCHPQ